MSSARESRAPIRMESSDIELRKGKWTVEEENYANKIITLFNQGMLPVVAGTTLRTYLSDKLRCDPMRITKKYAGASCIGKQVFQLCDNYYECFQENERELQRLENLFLIRINGKGGGLSGKRGGGAGDAPLPHQSIYETSNLDAAATNPVAAPSSATKRPYKTNRRGSGSKAGGDNNKDQLSLNFVMLGGSPRLVNHRHSAEQKPGFSPHYDQYRSGSDRDYDEVSADEDSHGNHNVYYEGEDDEGEEEEEGDYGYAYDPDADTESALRHVQQQAALRQYQYQFNSHGDQHQHQQPGNNGNGKGKGGLYSSLQAGGRRVLSAPNLTELNLSSWKDTDYRPLPADSLKEMFSQPISCEPGGAAYPGQQYGAAGSGHLNGSLLPEHVYSALGSESGRYASSHAHGGRASAATGSSAAAVMAARARATKLALQHHQQEQQLRAAYPYPYQQQGSSAAAASYRAADDSAHHFGGLGAAGMAGKRMKRSHSAMALMDFEKLAGDDTAAGDFFLQFLNKVSGTSNTNTPRRASKTESSSGAEGGAVSASGVADLVLEETTSTSATVAGDHKPPSIVPVAETKADALHPVTSGESAAAHAYVPSAVGDVGAPHISSASASLEEQPAVESSMDLC